MTEQTLSLHARDDSDILQDRARILAKPLTQEEE